MCLGGSTAQLQSSCLWVWRMGEISFKMILQLEGLNALQFCLLHVLSLGHAKPAGDICVMIHIVSS